ncbi:MAG: hypothetical protein ACR2H5_19375 [Ktedonobacteraceae bacterium]
MTHNPTRSPLDQDDFDLNNIFIGREQQVILFNFYVQQWDAYFWQGMLRAYYYREPSHDKETMETFRKALDVGLPPVLLTPLYWLERDNPAFFARCAKPLLDEYDV